MRIPEEWRKSFGLRLRTIREYRGKKQDEVRVVLGVCQTTLSRFENGKFAPNAYHLFALSRFYNWPFSGFDPALPLLDPILLVPIPLVDPDAPEDEEPTALPDEPPAVVE